MDQYTKKDSVIAFSGGVDSTLLLRAALEFAKENRTTVYAVTINTKLHPMNELEDTKKIAQELGVDYKIILADELADAGILENPVDRCYLCKKHLFEKIRKLSDELGASVIMDGTNDDDENTYRPGIKVLRELEIKSPLAEAGLSKIDVRVLAKEYGLSVAKKPSAPCLATRFPYDTQISYEKLEKVSKGEEFLKKFELYNVRIRVHDDIARIEVNREEFDKLINHKEEITAYLKELGYVYITLDLEGFRSGSMDYKMELKER
jgi:uncharacterized protein